MAVEERGDRLRMPLSATHHNIGLDDRRRPHRPLCADAARWCAEVHAIRSERPVDFDLVRHGLLPLEQLHPLVGDAILPGLAGLFEGPPDPVPDMSPVRVRCQGEWHMLGDEPPQPRRRPDAS